jgi:DNA-binding protein HU-beta
MTTKTDFVNLMAQEMDCSKAEAQKATDAFLQCIENEMVKSNKVTFPGFGAWEVKERAAREGRNPKTGESMQISASKVVSFKAGKTLKDIVNQ